MDEGVGGGEEEKERRTEEGRKVWGSIKGEGMERRRNEGWER